MKKKGFLGVLVVLVFLILAAGCENEDGNGDTSVLNLSGQVWTRSPGEGNEYVHFSGNLEIISSVFWGLDGQGNLQYFNIGGSGSIADGQLSFSIGKPSELISIQNFYIGGFVPNYLFDNFNISSADAKAAQILDIIVSGGRLVRSWDDYYISDYVFYIYVDRDVTLTGTGKTMTSECHCEENFGFCNCRDDECECSGKTTITKNLNLNLKTGWNVMTFKDEGNELEQSWTIEISAGDSSGARWVLWEDNN